MDKRSKSRSFFSRSTPRQQRALYNNDMSPDYHDHLAIQNTLALYCVCLDTKDYDLLREVFTVDVEAFFPFGAAKGLGQTSSLLRGQLSSTTTHHALTTQHINYPLHQPTHRRTTDPTAPPGPTLASAMTYFTATHFGKGAWAGHTFTTYGKYIDELVRIADDGYDNTIENGDGAAAPAATYGEDQWRICRREVKIMAKVGDERILFDQRPASSSGLLSGGGGASAGVSRDGSVSVSASGRQRY